MHSFICIYITQLYLFSHSWKLGHFYILAIVNFTKTKICIHIALHGTEELTYNHCFLSSFSFFRSYPVVFRAYSELCPLGITTGRLGVVAIEPRLAMYKARVLDAVLTLIISHHLIIWKK